MGDRKLARSTEPWTWPGPSLSARSPTPTESKRLACTAEFSSGTLVEKEINGGNPAVPDNDEISPGVSWRLTRAARYPLDPPAIAQFLGSGNWLILKVGVSGLDRSRHPINLVAAT